MAYVKVVKSSAYYSRYQVRRVWSLFVASDLPWKFLTIIMLCCRSSTSAGVRCAAANKRLLSISSCQQ